MSELGDPGQLARLVTGRRSKWVVIVVWLALLGGFGTLAGGLSGAQTNDAAAWLPGDSESAEAVDALTPFYDSENFDTNIVVDRADGKALTKADQDAVNGLSADIAKIEHVVPTPTVEVAKNQQAALIHTIINPGTGGWETILEVANKIRDLGDELPGLTLYVAGPGGNAADSMEAFGGIDGALLVAALLVVVVALLVTYRSPVLWLLPVITVVTALGVSMGIVYLLATEAGLTVNAQTFSILPILVFGAGTDYALLLIARYREELRHHEDKHEAMALALHRAGPAVFASAITVVIGLLCLVLAAMNSTAGLGPVCAVGVVIAMGAMLTLLPAMLLACGRWVFWPANPAFGSEDHTSDGIWARVGAVVAKSPRLVWVGTTVVLLALSSAFLGLDAQGLNSKESFTFTPDSVKGDAIVAKNFDAGAGVPIFVVAREDKAQEVVQAIAGVEGVIPQSVVPFAAAKDGVVPIAASQAAASDTKAARDTIERVREAVHEVDGADALVGGQTAVMLDMIDASSRDNRVIIPIILAVVMLVLCLLLRAVVAPVILLLTVVLSYGAAMGISTLIFEHIFKFEGADASFPLFAFVFLVALGIDYNIFLMTRVREEATRVGTREGALVGLRATGGVITSAGLVLAGTFAVLGTLPLVFAAELGVAVALGVLIDTFIVRSVLVTAVTLDVGRFMWWPNALWHKRDDEVPPAPPVREPALVDD